LVLTYKGIRLYSAVNTIEHGGKIIAKF